MDHPTKSLRWIGIKRTESRGLFPFCYSARLVSRFADDGSVQALALSLVPPDLAALLGDAQDHSLPAVTRCVETLLVYMYRDCCCCCRRR